MEPYRKNINRDTTCLYLGLFVAAFGIFAVLMIHPVAWSLVGIGSILLLYGVVWGQRWVEFNERGISTKYMTQLREVPWADVAQSKFEEFENNHALQMDLRNGKQILLAVERKDIPKINAWVEAQATLDAPSPAPEKPATEWLDACLDYGKPVFALILGAFLAWMSGLMVLEVYNGSRSTRWPTTAGTVTGSSVTSETKTSGRRIKSKRTYYKPTVTYDYAVDGKTYHGERISFSPVSTEDRKEAYAFSRQLLANPQINVRYDPANPAESVLMTGIDSSRQLLTVLMGVGSLAALGFGGYHLYLLLRSRPSHA